MKCTEGKNFTERLKGYTYNSDTDLNIYRFFPLWCVGLSLAPSLGNWSNLNSVTSHQGISWTATRELIALIWQNIRKLLVNVRFCSLNFKQHLSRLTCTERFFEKEIHCKKQQQSYILTYMTKKLFLQRKSGLSLNIQTDQGKTDFTLY